MLHRNNIRTATAYFTHLHNTVFACAVNIRLNRRVTVFDKIYQVGALSQDKGNVMPEWHPEKRGLGVTAISSQHCLREASAELDKHLSCWTFLIPASSLAVGALLILDRAWPDPGPTLPPHPEATPPLLHTRPVKWIAKAPPVQGKRCRKGKWGLCQLKVEDNSCRWELMQVLTKEKGNFSSQLHIATLCCNVQGKPYQWKESFFMALCLFRVIFTQIYTRCASTAS